MTQTYDFLQDLLQTMPHNPPYHTEIEMPTLPPSQTIPTWPSWPEVHEKQREAFRQNVRTVTPFPKEELRQP